MNWIAGIWVFAMAFLIGLVILGLFPDAYSYSPIRVILFAAICQGFGYAAGYRDGKDNRNIAD